VRGGRNSYHTNGCQKKARVAILTLEKIDFKTKTVTIDKGHYIIIKWTIQQEDITIANIYAHNMGATKYIKQLITNIKELIDNNTVIVEDFNTPLISMEISSKQKINKETVVLSETRRI